MIKVIQRPSGNTVRLLWFPGITARKAVELAIGSWNRVPGGSSVFINERMASLYGEPEPIKGLDPSLKGQIVDHVDTPLDDVNFEIVMADIHDWTP